MVMESERRTISYNSQFEEILSDTYPAATSISQAFVMAAQDGALYRSLESNGDIDETVRTVIREIVTDELERAD